MIAVTHTNGASTAIEAGRAGAHKIRIIIAWFKGELPDAYASC